MCIGLTPICPALGYELDFSLRGVVFLPGFQKDRDIKAS
jgi:hypothetical protein